TSRVHAASPRPEPLDSMRNRPAALAPPALLLAALSPIMACWSAADRSAAADAAALENVRRAQEAAFGSSGEFTIERPSETFRRRLMVNQDLPHAIRASLSTAELPPIDH